mmetsp:Transcript_17463/g.31345  ORF Transcript_17463/g.31345 Transcript_17463/m.31345 type:complete len:94 (+) Transcript_17463:270-551(+)
MRESPEDFGRGNTAAAPQAQLPSATDLVSVTATSPHRKFNNNKNNSTCMGNNGLGNWTLVIIITTVVLCLSQFVLVQSDDVRNQHTTCAAVGV